MYVKANTGSGARPFPEQWQEFSSNLVATFNDAQSAWDAYRKHLIEQGFLPSAK